MAQPQATSRQGPYNMAALANAIPQGNYQQAPYNPSQLRYDPGASSNVVGQTQAMTQYNGQPTMNHLQNHPYYMRQQQAQLSHFYGAPISPAHPQSNMSPRGNIPYYGNQAMANHQAHPTMAYYYPQMPPLPAQGQPQHQVMSAAYMPAAGSQPDSRTSGTQTGGNANGDTPIFSPTQEQSQGSTDGRSNVVRGPPRKPRQSGHALWVGNLPAQTQLMDLVHHVCKESEGLESLFLIARSNCAFANYKDEATCLAAQQKLHESRFQSVRLVSRLRKNTVEGASGVTAPTGPSATTSPQPVMPEAREDPVPEVADLEASKSDADSPSVVSTSEAKTAAAVDGSAQKDKFFILKSLTLEDLELSVRNGVWATQSHNEETLNNAFQNAENVYLVFSANKSGEYYGYARMLSTINEDPEAAIEFAPKAQSVNDVDLPQEILTEASESTPKGRIIDDSARGTIFWEVAREDSSGSPERDTATLATGINDDAISVPDGGPDSKVWGKPFRLEWLCTTRLPFYRCRGLRNPWNSNREVKIARDGTELEPSVGRRLIGLFNRNHVSSPVARGPMVGIGQMPMLPPQQSMLMGYPPPFS